MGITAVNHVLGERLNDLELLCSRRHVRRLDLFGSVLGDRFDPERSDLDFLVTFDNLPPGDHADAYFGPMEDLERVLGRPVDLVEQRAIRNPYFRRAVERDRVTLYEA